MTKFCDDSDTNFHLSPSHCCGPVLEEPLDIVARRNVKVCRVYDHKRATDDLTLGDV